MTKSSTPAITVTQTENFIRVTIIPGTTKSQTPAAGVVRVGDNQTLTLRP